MRDICPFRIIKRKIRNSDGFSLVELIIVIAILIVLLAMLIPMVTSNIAKARIASNSTAAASIYLAATTAVTNNICAGRTGNDIKTHLAGTEPDYSLMGCMGAKIPNTGSATVYLEQNSNLVICVEYTYDGETYVNPPVYCKPKTGTTADESAYYERNHIGTVTDDVYTGNTLTIPLP